MIPVVICPCISRFDFLERMMRTIDHPVGRLVIVDNSCEGYVAPDEFAHLNVRYIRPLEGIGYGGGINEGIRETAEQPWWFFTNNDICFTPGALARVAETMDAATGPRLFTFGFSWGALNQAAVAAAGLFDDWSFFPIYFDDNDLYRRCELAGVEIIQDETVNEYPDGASHTIRSSRRFTDANNRTFVENRTRYVAKWGGMPGHETFTTPWNKDVPLWFVQPDLPGRGARKW